MTLTVYKCIRCGNVFHTPDCPYCEAEKLKKSQPQDHSVNEARKADTAKLRTDLIPPEAITGLARVLTYGVAKYEARNWEKGTKWGRLFGAGIRHLFQFWGGEDRDQESGLLHLEHALACIVFLLAYYRRGIGTDDRGPETGDTFELNFNPKEVAHQ